MQMRIEHSDDLGGSRAGRSIEAASGSGSGSGRAGTALRHVRSRAGRAGPRRGGPRWPGILIAAAVMLVGFPSTPRAHEIPADVTVRTFVHPDDGVLRFLVRVPLSAMRDFDWPVTGPGFLDIEAARPMLEDAARMWIRDYVTFYENGEALDLGEVRAARISLPSNRSFDDYEAALAHMEGPRLEGDRELVVNQSMLDVLLEYPIESATSDFSLRSTLAHLGLQTNTVLRFVTLEGDTRIYQYHGDPGLIRLDPRWYHAAFRFVGSGVHHILIGWDHLLFLLCLVIPFRNLRGLIPIVTSFTVAHSITLIASAMGMAPTALWFPPFIEALIALSIVYMAFENIVGAKLHRRWLVTFGFGLIHGFGFSFVLAEELQFAGSHLLTSLLAFNVGVEIGQILVLLLAVPALSLLFRYGLRERLGTILLSALVAHTAWHWTTDRAGALMAYQVRLPVFDVAFAATLLRWLMLALIVGGVLWALYELFGRWERDGPDAIPAGGLEESRELPGAGFGD